MMNQKLYVNEGYRFYSKILKSPKCIVAPMVEQSELAWRMMARKNGADLCYTPMHNARKMLLSELYQEKILEDLSCKEDRPLIVQFCANTPAEFLKASLLVQDHCDGVDLNLGCPQNAAMAGFFGAYLQNDWMLIHNIISESRKQLHVGVSAKIRIYEEVDLTVPYTKMLEDAGCHLITVHGRTCDQKGKDTGLADWGQINTVKNNLNIPVFANGNIRYHGDISRCLKQTGADGVMVAEGHLTNPMIFKDVKANVYDIIEEYLCFAEVYPTCIRHVKKHVFTLLVPTFHIYPQYKNFLKHTNTIKDIREECRRLQDICMQKNKEKYHVESTGLPCWVCQPYSNFYKLKMKDSERNQRFTEVNENVQLTRGQMRRYHRTCYRRAKWLGSLHKRRREFLFRNSSFMTDTTSHRKNLFQVITEVQLAALNKVRRAIKLVVNWTAEFSKKAQ